MTGPRLTPAESAALSHCLAAHSAKNKPTRQGLPTHHTGSNSERNPMVGTTDPTVSPTAPDVAAYSAVAALLGQRPFSTAPASERAGWLWQLAAALDAIDQIEDADDARDAAMSIVRDIITHVAGGGE
jgi:hypothetical protein